MRRLHIPLTHAIKFRFKNHNLDFIRRRKTHVDFSCFVCSVCFPMLKNSSDLIQKDSAAHIRYVCNVRWELPHNAHSPSRQFGPTRKIYILKAFQVEWNGCLHRNTFQPAAHSHKTHATQWSTHPCFTRKNNCSFIQKCELNTNTHVSFVLGNAVIVPQAQILAEEQKKKKKKTNHQVR